MRPASAAPEQFDGSQAVVSYVYQTPQVLEHGQGHLQIHRVVLRQQNPGMRVPVPPAVSGMPLR
ncbi:MAG: hypothetical protein MZV70_16770 [Desulfobacterales bacterium]|nr:hypothetical protein [Desulfobacterales bacterium]